MADEPTEPKPPRRRRARPSMRAVVSNWRGYDAGFLTKIRMALRNTGTKIVRLDNCCGHPGEPGC